MSKAISMEPHISEAMRWDTATGALAVRDAVRSSCLRDRKERESSPEAVLHNFLGDPDGAGPLAGVVADQTGNLYGTTYGGGDSAQGTAFQLMRPGNSNQLWTENVLYRWLGLNGVLPSDGSDDPRAAISTSRQRAAVRRVVRALSKLRALAGEGLSQDIVLYDFIGGGTNPAHPDSKLVLL